MRSRTSFTSRGNSTPPTLEKVRDEPVLVVQTDELYSVPITNTECYLDFRAMVKPSMPLEYAKKHFAPALHAVIR
jgi:hypothetical protein